MKNKSRREFLNSGLKAGIIAPILGNSILSQANPLIASQSLSKSGPLKILILGGTSFLGPHQIAYALEQGHSVSIFTRGKTVPTIHKEVFKNVEHLIGDRENNLEALRDRKWDAVIDNSGRRSKWTRDAAQLLKNNVRLYLYTSSTGVYYPYKGSDITENTTPVLVVPKNITEEQNMEYSYGVMKANSEIEAMNAFGAERTIVVRPTYMMGPGDRTDRFTYWPIRLKNGGEILVPGKTQDPVQYIDVRDVANWMIRLIENGTHGSFNAVGPASQTGVSAFVYGAHAAFNSSASFVQIPDYEFLKKHNIFWAIPWIMPVGDNFGSARVNIQKGVENGLSYRPLADSCQDIIEWWYSDAVSQERKTNMESGKDSLMTREGAILKDWKSQW